jgi:predicted nucleic acid-binding protein
MPMFCLLPLLVAKNIISSFSIEINYILRTFIEIEKYRKKILKKAKLKNQQFFDFNVRLFSQISVIPALALSVESLELAYDLCEEIDTKDVMYIALTIEFKDAKLITRDKVLHDKLHEKGFEKIVLFQQVFDDFLAE